MSATLNQPVVIDNGTGVIKAGFAGADKPKVGGVGVRYRTPWPSPTDFQNSIIYWTDSRREVSVLLCRKGRLAGVGTISLSASILEAGAIVV